MIQPLCVFSPLRLKTSGDGYRLPESGDKHIYNFATMTHATVSINMYNCIKISIQMHGQNICVGLKKTYVSFRTFHMQRVSRG